VEAAHSIGIVERYHKPLRRAYTVIMDEFKENGNITMWNKGLIRQMAVKGVNDTAGPDGIIPTLFVFGAFPRMLDSLSKYKPSFNNWMKAFGGRSGGNTVVTMVVDPSFDTINCTASDRDQEGNGRNHEVASHEISQRCLRTRKDNRE